MTRNQPPIACTTEQLRRLYPEPIPTIIAGISKQIPAMQQQFLGEDITRPLYELFLKSVPKIALDEGAALFALSFAIPTKNAVEISMDNPPNHYRNMVYKLVRDKKEIIGIKPAGQIFLNFVQVTQFCEEFIKSGQKQQPELVIKALKAFADRILGEGQWDKSVLSEGYVQNVMKRLQGTVPGKTQEAFITVKMQDVQRQVFKQQRELMKFASYKQDSLVVGKPEEQDRGVGSFDIRDPDSE